MRVDFQQAAPYLNYRPLTLAQWRVFVPLYLRIGSPANRLHLLTGPAPPSSSAAPMQMRPIVRAGRDSPGC